MTPPQSYILWETDTLTSIDLNEELALLRQDNPTLEGIELYIARIGEHAEGANVLYNGLVNRAGIAWGADADWTDAFSPEDAMERYLGLHGKAMEA